MRESREDSVTISYTGGGADYVHLPVSTPDFIVYELEVEPADTEHTFAPGEHRLRLPSAGTVIVRCRYRQFRSIDADGHPLPWRTPAEIFPGAEEIANHEE